MTMDDVNKRMCNCDQHRLHKDCEECNHNLYILVMNTLFYIAQNNHAIKFFTGVVLIITLTLVLMMTMKMTLYVLNVVTNKILLQFIGMIWMMVKC